MRLTWRSALISNVRLTTTFYGILPHYWRMVMGFGGEGAGMWDQNPERAWNILTHVAFINQEDLAVIQWMEKVTSFDCHFIILQSSIDTYSTHINLR